MPPALSILAVTNMYPTSRHPTLGIFVEQQVKGLRAIGLEVSVFFVNRAEEGMHAYFRMLKSLRELVEQARPALLHVMYGGVMAERVMRWKSKIPKVVTFHGSDLLGENLSGPFRKWVSLYGVHCSHRAARQAQGVVVVSDALRSALPCGVEPSRVRVIPCGIDLRRFKPADKLSCQQQLGWSGQVFHVLFASNNGDAVKRPWLALAAVEQLQRAGARAELHVMHGVPYDAVPIWINASDVLIVTSQQEGSPTVVKEALACGVPVVSVDVGDVRQRIEGVDGCYISPAEPESLATKLMLVRLAACRINPQTNVQEFGIDHIARRLDRFYREILALSSHSKSNGAINGT